MKLLLLVFAVFLYSTHASAQNGWRYIGPEERNVTHMSIKGDLIFASLVLPPASVGGGYSTKLIYRSTDAGDSWVVIDTNLIHRSASIMILEGPTPSQPFLIGATATKFYYSDDIGITWDSTDQHDPSISRFYPKDNFPGLLFGIGGYKLERLFRSTDYGRTWTEPYVFPASSDGAQIAVGVSPTTADVYVNVDTDIGGQYFFHSQDDGMMWEYVGSGEFIKQLTIDPDDAASIFSSANGRILKSTDGGVSWHQIYSAGSGISILWDRSNPNLLLTLETTGPQRGVSVSDDRGKTWRHDSTSLNLPFKQVFSNFEAIAWLKYEPVRKRLYLQTTKGIYMTENFLTAVTEVETASITFLHSYPQPAQQHLRITTGHVKSAKMSLRVYTTLGRELRQWMLDTEREISWDLTDGNGAPLPSGLYLLVIQDGTTILSKTIVIQR